MVRQRSGEMMASPTPSIDSLNSAAAVGSLCGLDQVITLVPDKCQVLVKLLGNSDNKVQAVLRLILY